MAIATYSDLLTLGANMTGRADLTSRWPEFITLIEGWMNRELRTVFQETKNAAFSIAAEYTALPTDFLDLKTIHVNGPPKVNLVYKADDLMSATYASATGTPTEYNVQGANIRVNPTPTGATACTLVYIAKVPALTSGAPTNWVITNFPDLYVAGVNYYAWQYAMNAEKTLFWQNRMEFYIAQLKALSDKYADRNQDEDYRDDPRKRP